MSDTATIFQAFIEADKAIKELPAIKETLANVTTDRDGALHQLEQAEAVIKSHEDEIAQLKAALEAKEAALVDATFRHKEVSTTLDSLRNLLGVVPVPESQPTPPVTVNPEPAQSVVGESTTSTTEPKSETVVVNPAFPPDVRPSHIELTASPAADSIPAGTSPSAIETSAEPTPSAVSQTLKPYEGHAYWLKPNSLSWADWANQGGEVPSWITDRNLH